jgi:hypothetical protein
MTLLRRFAAGAALAGAALLVAPGPSADAAEPKAALAQLAAGLTVRFGVFRDSLVVLPLVLEGDPPEGDGLLDAGATATWRRGDGAVSLVDVTDAAVPASRERYVPAGTLLEGGDRERMLDRPVPLVGGEHSLSTTIVCDNRAKPVEAHPDAQQVTVLAPIEQRRFQFLGNRENLMDVLVQIQACLAELPVTTDTVAAILDAQVVKDGVRDRWTELSKIPGAYGGKTVGHVAFFGYRPVEIVAFARPADYRAVGPAYLRSVAASHVLWSAAVGNGAAKATDADVRRLIGEATAVVESLPKIHSHEVRPQAGERVRWKLFAGTASSAPRANGASETFACRFALDAKGDFAFVEGLEAGDDPVYLEPYREPGGRKVSDHPDNKGNGAMTPEAMKRMLERILMNRDRQRAAQGR